MTARFRPVWLVLDPFVGSRELLGMLVEERPEVRFVAACDGQWPRLSREEAALARLVVEELQMKPHFDVLPVGAEPHTALGDVASVPALVLSPARWVAEHLLGRRDAA